MCAFNSVFGNFQIGTLENNIFDTLSLYVPFKYDPVITRTPVFRTIRF